MNRLPTITALTIAVAAAIAAVVGGAAQASLHRHGFGNGAAAGVAVAVIAGATLVLRAALRDYLFSQRVLRRALLGPTFVEGRWVDVVWLRDGTCQLGVTYVGAQGDGLEFSGVNYTRDGARIGSFRTTATNVDREVLSFICETYSSPELTRGRAAGEIQFVRRGGPAREYTGWFIDLSGTVRAQFHGIKVGRRDAKRLDDPDACHERLLALTAPLVGRPAPPLYTEADVEQH